MAVRVTIFDDNKRLLDSLSVLIDGSPGFQMAGIFENCNNLISDIERTQPDVILMDIEMPGINGIEAVKMVKHRFPKMNVMMQTAFENDENVCFFFCAGASGYILKNTPPSRILESIREAATGGAPMTPSIAHKILEVFLIKKPALATDDHSQLNERQQEILDCIFNGMSYKLIAEKLFISVDTVRYHVKNIYEILHVHSRDELISRGKGKTLLSF